MTRAALALVLASQLALGADPGDAGTDAGVAGPVAIAVESATLRPLDAPTAPLEVGPGVYLPEDLALTTASKVAAYEAARASQGTSVSPWIVVVVLAALGLLGAGFAAGWVARPTAAQ